MQRSFFLSFVLFIKKKRKSLVLGGLCQYINFFLPTCKSYFSMMKLLQSMT